MSSDESENDFEPVVLELGSWKTRAGMAGEDAPAVVRHTCIPESVTNLDKTELDYTERFCSDKFEHLLQMCYNELPMKDPAERGVVLIEPQYVSKASSRGCYSSKYLHESLYIVFIK
eukprot:sb/3476547/